ncbi:unnamed protein product, partial [Didymodactylos carnosus]
MSENTLFNPLILILKDDFNKFPQTLIVFQEERTAECGQNIIDPYTGGPVHYTGVYGGNEMIVEDVDTKAKRKVLKVICKMPRITKVNHFVNTPPFLFISLPYNTKTLYGLPQQLTVGAN